MSEFKQVVEPPVIASEPWLDKSPKARKSVERGIAQAKAGQLIKTDEDFSKYMDAP